MAFSSAVSSQIWVKGQSPQCPSCGCIQSRVSKRLWSPKALASHLQDVHQIDFSDATNMANKAFHSDRKSNGGNIPKQTVGTWHYTQQVDNKHVHQPVKPRLSLTGSQRRRWITNRSVSRDEVQVRAEGQASADVIHKDVLTFLLQTEETS